MNFLRFRSILANMNHSRNLQSIQKSTIYQQSIFSQKVDNISRNQRSINVSTFDLEIKIDHEFNNRSRNQEIKNQ